MEDMSNNNANVKLYTFPHRIESPMLKSMRMLMEVSML